MTCVICKHGTTAPGTTRMAVERGSTVLVVRGVPAQVCELAVAAEGGVQVEVREYIAA
ncbi:MAG: YgiT-type zinc finger protein [Acidobacteria bacterium]|nr:YgiT-type zinc finger protein [Acidobacteriota bacterium]